MNRKENKIKEKGITLIALVITIIVLLILAGVTINLTLGDNGIFKVAEQAARNYKDAENKELGLLDDFTNTLDKTVNDLQYATLASKAKTGDYVKYDGGNGYTGLWQVLYNDATYGLQIISADIVNEGNLFTLGGSTEVEAKASYNGAVDTLNAECRKYVNTKYAQSGRCVGSDPLSPDDAVTETVTLKFTYNDTTESGCKVGDYNEETDFNAMKNATNQNAEGIHKASTYYWLASRYVSSDSNVAHFVVRYVYVNEVKDADDLWRVTSDGFSGPYRRNGGFRPVVTLYSDIQTSAGNGSEGSAFELVAK